jgi:sterol 14-demethylase
MVGKTFTYLVGSEASALLFNSKNSDLNAEDVYQKLVTPVFGEGVAYDVPHHIFLEQKKMLKSGLSQAHFRRYVPLIEKETLEYFERWGDSGEIGVLCVGSALCVGSDTGEDMPCVGGDTGGDVPCVGGEDCMWCC